MEAINEAVNGDSTVAYFSMEVALDPEIPTYSGGLGVLAGDTLRAAADLSMGMVAVTLLYRKGYFRQHLDNQGNQTEAPYSWSPEDFLDPLEPRVSVTLEGRKVTVRAWRYSVKGVSGHEVPVYLLDTALPENSEFDRTLTDQLYGGDVRYRLCQETILGIGGVAMLRALGYSNIATFHMNEGHSALLALALLEEQTGDRGLESMTAEDIEVVHERCVFTTHTPVPAGHDKFDIGLVRRVLGEQRTAALIRAGCCTDSTLNMTFLAMFTSHYVNGVSMRHEEVSSGMFPGYSINAISNGVHATTWTSHPFQRLYDKHIPQWRKDNLYLRYAISISPGEVQAAHAQAKRDLLAEVRRATGVGLDPHVFTIGFARRATGYKRPDLLFSDLDRLRTIARHTPIQIVYAGKAHPRDQGGKDAIRRIFDAAASLQADLKVVYLEEYGMALGKLMCSGVDLWLNTPLKPQEASGTSGMKAALNGVPSLSILDGWWLEGCVEGVTGWAIGEDQHSESIPALEIASLYNKLEFVILPMFYSRPAAYAEVMRHAIAINGSFFNAQRTMFQYLTNAYLKNSYYANKQVS